MIDKINELLNERFAYGEYGLRRYDDNDISIITAIEELFREEGFAEDDFSVDSDVVFSNPAVDTGYVSVAFIENGKLNHTTYIFDV